MELEAQKDRTEVAVEETGVGYLAAGGEVNPEAVRPFTRTLKVEAPIAYSRPVSVSANEVGRIPEEPRVEGALCGAGFRRHGRAGDRNRRPDEGPSAYRGREAAGLEVVREQDRGQRDVSRGRYRWELPRPAGLRPLVMKNLTDQTNLPAATASSYSVFSSTDTFSRPALANLFLISCARAPFRNA